MRRAGIAAGAARASGWRSPRAIAMHGGSIEARNLERGGLAVSMLLPAVASGRSPARSAAAA